MAVRSPTPCACGAHAHVVLTKGYVAIIDLADAETVGRYSWCASPNNRGKGYVRVFAKVNGAPMTMGRYLLQAQPGFVADHINGDTLDNRRANLRAITQKQNAQNRAKSATSLNPYKGVRKLDPRYVSRPWAAFISVDGVTRNLGAFSTPEEAALAYDAAAKALYGDYARPNIPAHSGAYEEAVE